MPVSLLDIAPATADVPLGDGRAITVHGITAAEAARLLRRFPALLGMLDADTGELDLFDLGPAFVAAAIAAAVHQPGAEYEAAAAALPLHQQAEILGAVMQLTMPQGLVPFVERLSGLAGDAATLAALGSPSPSGG